MPFVYNLDLTTTEGAIIKKSLKKLLISRYTFVKTVSFNYHAIF